MSRQTEREERDILKVTLSRDDDDNAELLRQAADHLHDLQQRAGVYWALHAVSFTSDDWGNHLSLYLEAVRPFGIQAAPNASFDLRFLTG